MNLIRANSAKIALPTSTGDPLDASSITNLPALLHAFTHSHHRASSLVTSDTASDVLHTDAEITPFIVEKRFV
jgi:hypothetical protein